VSFPTTIIDVLFPFLITKDIRQNLILEGRDLSKAHRIKKHFCSSFRVPGSFDKQQDTNGYRR